jgi:hypothetical protein
MQSVMAYSTWSEPHKHMKPKTLHIPAYGAQVIPYRWTLKKSGFELAQELELGASLEYEPSEPDFLKRTNWIQQHQNQRALLESFAAPLVTDKSLVLFYTPRTPLCDDQRRVLASSLRSLIAHCLKLSGRKQLPNGPTAVSCATSPTTR